MFSIADFIVLAFVAIALAAALRRLWRGGSCIGCADAGSCSHSCATCGKKGCPVDHGVDAVVNDVGRDFKCAERARGACITAPRNDDETNLWHS